MEFGATPRFTRILLTGPPGIGKTSVCKKIVQLLESCNYTLDGFYTEEVRLNKKARVGFDIVPLKNHESKAPLARIETALGEHKRSNIYVGNYQVFIDEFERVALPTLQTQSDILIIDEIGKMELFSKNFQVHVENLFFEKSDKKMCIIATIPAKDRVPQRYSQFFKKFYHDTNCKVLEVNRQNRDELPEIIINILTKILH